MQLFGSKKSSKHAKAQHEKAAENIREYDIDIEYDYPQQQAPSNGASAQRKNSAAAQEIIKNKKKKNKKKKTAKIIFTILIILLLVVGAAYLLIEYFTEAPSVSSDGISSDYEIKEGVTNGRHNGMYTFLVVGLDQVSGSTDTIMVGRLDAVNGTLNIINIPRDTLVDSPYEIKKINAIYPAGENSKNSDGITDLMEMIKNMVGFSIDNYAVINLQAAADIVDEIGGVDFDVPVNMQYDDPTQDLHIDINQGYQTLNGEQTVQVLRFRATYAGGDIQRISVQQDLFKALASQLLSLGSIPHLGDILDIVDENVVTSLSDDNIRFFIKEFLKLDKDNINFMTLPGNTGGSLDGLSYVFPYIDEWIEMVNENLNPWTQEITEDNLDMITYINGQYYSTVDNASSSKAQNDD